MPLVCLYGAGSGSGQYQRQRTVGSGSVWRATVQHDDIDG